MGSPELTPGNGAKIALLSRVGNLGSVLSVFGLSFVGWLLVWAVGPLAIGWTPYLVTSESMSPVLAAGDVVVAEPSSGTATPGEVLVVADTTPGAVPLIHRVHALTPEGLVVTKGDANPLPDSTPVDHSEILATPKLKVPLIGLPALWMYRGDIPQLVGFAAVFMLGFASTVRPKRPRVRQSVPDLRVSPRLSGRGTHRRPARPLTPTARRLGTVSVLIGGIVATSLVVAPVRAVFASSSLNSANSLAAASSFSVVWYLHDDPTPPTANQPSQAILPLNTSAPTAPTLYNYDTDRDAFPGIVLNKATGLSETAADKIQRWAFTAVTPLTVQGTATLSLWSVSREYNVSKGGGIQAGLYDCNVNNTGCTTIATGTANSTPWSPTGTWTNRTISFGAVNRTVAAGRKLMIRLVVAPTSADSLWFAYDTTAYPARLTVTP